MLVIPTPPLTKVASNTGPCSKRGGTTLKGGSREVSIISNRPVISSDLKQKRSFFCQSVTGCSNHVRSTSLINQSSIAIGIITHSRQTNLIA